MPTFRKGCNREQESFLNQNNIFNLEQYPEEKLIDFLKKNNYLLCIKKYPNEELNMVDLQNENICRYFFDGYKLNKNLVKHVDSVKRYKDRVDEISRLLDEKNEVIADREKRIKELDLFISNIINSKDWKFLEKIRNVKKVFNKKN